MQFKKWVIPVIAYDDSISSSFEFVIPFYTEDEMTELQNRLVSLFPSGNYGQVTNAGGIESTELGEFLFNDMGLKYVTFPYVTPIGDFYDKTWENLVTGVIPGLTNVMSFMTELPVSSVGETFATKKFKNTNSGTGVTYDTGTFAYYVKTGLQSQTPVFSLAATTSGRYENAEYGTSWMIHYVLLVLNESGDVSKFVNFVLQGSQDRGLQVTKDVKNVQTNLNAIPEVVTDLFLSNDTGEVVDPTDVNTDPYAPGGESGTGGGNGTFDWSGDSVGIPDLPSITATDAGFITLFNPSLTQLRSLASYMWSDLFDVSGWQKIFADPMDAILGLSIVPVAVPDGGTGVVKVGNISTGVSMTKAASQYVSVDCGTLTIKEQYNSYLDYEPFSRADIYLPFIGFHALSVDDVMGASLHVVYHVDILSGACVAYLEITRGDSTSVHYTYIGQCSSSIPITGNDWTNVINGVLNIAGSIGSMVATGGASAPLALGSIASTAVNSMKPSVEKSGSLSGTGGLMANKTPYIILTRPRQCVPKNQGKYMGYPAFITVDLSDLSGYTEVEHIRLTGTYGTEQEMDEIYRLLKSGVIF